MWVGWFWDDSTAQQSSRTPGSSILLFHHLQSVGFYSWVWCLSVTEWLPLFRTSWPHTIMPMGRKQGEGQHGNLGLSSWVSFFHKRAKTFPKASIRVYYILLVIIGLYGPALAAREAEKWVPPYFKLYSGKGVRKKELTMALVTNNVCHSDKVGEWMNEQTNQQTNIIW